MKQKIAQLIAALALLVVPLLAVPQPALAAACGESQAAKEVLGGIGQTGNSCDDSGVFKTVKAVIEILSIIVGIAAIIMIIVSGFRFITSGGDSGKVSSARSGLIYSLIGVAVAALAQLFVRFVLAKLG